MNPFVHAEMMRANAEAARQAQLDAARPPLGNLPEPVAPAPEPVAEPVAEEPAEVVVAQEE